MFGFKIQRFSNVKSEPDLHISIYYCDVIAEEVSQKFDDTIFFIIKKFDFLSRSKVLQSCDTEEVAQIRTFIRLTSFVRRTAVICIRKLAPK